MKKTSSVITNNEKEQQFEYKTAGHLATLSYRFYKDDIAFMHTIVPGPIAGKGIGSSLATYAFEYAKKLNKKVMMYCPFVVGFVRKHPELNGQIDWQYHSR